MTHRLIVGFDLDKTIWHENPKHHDNEDWENPDRINDLVPDDEVIAWAKALDADLVFITGRNQEVREDLAKRLHGLGLHGPVYTQKKWLGHAAMQCHKAAAILDHNVDIYVGDHASDMAAANMAGIVFLDIIQLKANLAGGQA